MIGRARSAKFDSAMEAYNADESRRALRLMEECASEGDPVACFMVALWYRKGEGTAPNAKRSTQWLDRLLHLAETNTEAQWEVSQNYRFGNLLPLNVAEANKWLERSAKGGSGDAQHHLAWFKEQGLYGYDVNPSEAATWYRRALDQEHPETLYLHATRLIGNGEPSEEAIELLKRAADKGFIQASDVLRRYSH